MKTSNRNVVINKCMTRKFRVGFLVGCQNWYWKPIEDNKQHSWMHVPIDMSKLVWCYGYGCRNGNIDITFEWFKKIVLEKLDPDGELYPKKRRAYKPCWWPRYDGGAKYKKGEGHGISDPDAHEIKSEWRARGGKERDRRRTYWRRGATSSDKTLRSRRHRRWVDRKLIAEDYDAFHSKEMEESDMPWDWY